MQIGSSVYANASSYASTSRTGGGQGHKGPSFSDLDTDGSGGISTDEFAAMFQKHESSGASSSTDTVELSSKMQDLFNSTDSNGDGEISSDEWDARPAPPPPPGGMPPPGGGGEGDDATGAVNSSSSSDFISKLKDFLAQLMDSADSNQDGSLSEEEMTSWIQQVQDQTTGALTSSKTQSTSVNYVA